MLEAWVLNEREKARIVAFEMWCYRRMWQIPWMKKVKNEEVLARCVPGQDNWKKGKMYEKTRDATFSLVQQGKIPENAL